MIFVKHKETFCSPDGQLAKGQSEEQDFPFRCIDSPKCWISPALLSSGFRPMFVFNHVLSSFCCVFHNKHPGQILNWYKSAGLNDFCLLHCCFAGTDVSCSTNKILCAESSCNIRADGMYPVPRKSREGNCS